ncbi:hypothetical protein EMIHUDRAFT_208237 [Emiliania huxleyi CCMP1516]|uniref:Uncharacterized protein n=2 Tax=Emiliania huxleyi TaxID=2903 RepID=A0A0D3JA74_EMIH1|nr:hypothetical protein EMIHUDRAFT_208237 [Emiliania huxleyi CCMP1516]EOD20409.1 hypothetical protein EMIHUDRAFT_208237 [Emiliania huxleyi CCMP1516]|eukprot:XP_005772838.1 hypothetical protein EMIHUDRAFT_208237 [Emiliania huxleyi CCMP1516]
MSFFGFGTPSKPPAAPSATPGTPAAPPAAERDLGDLAQILGDDAALQEAASAVAAQPAAISASVLAAEQLALVTRLQALSHRRLIRQHARAAAASFGGASSSGRDGGPEAALDACHVRGASPADGVVEEGGGGGVERVRATLAGAGAASLYVRFSLARDPERGTADLELQLQQIAPVSRASRCAGRPRDSGSPPWTVLDDSLRAKLDEVQELLGLPPPVWGPAAVLGLLLSACAGLPGCDPAKSIAASLRAAHREEVLAAA